MNQGDFLWLPDSLQQKKWQHFTHGFLDVLEKLEVPFGWISHTRSIWARDYMPVEVHEGVYVQFRYEPSYLEKYPEDKIPVNAGVNLLQNIDPEAQIWVVPLKLDGGNVVMNRNLAIVSERVFTENAHLPRTSVAKMLMEYLNREVIFIPVQSRDIIGHADGLVRFIDESNVLINAYREIDIGYWKSLMQKLNRYGLEVHFLTYNPYGNKNWLDASGTYLNFLQINDLILVPEYGDCLVYNDFAALHELKKLYNTEHVYPVPCSKLAREGGLLNCISWTGLSSYCHNPDSVTDQPQTQKGAKG